MAVSRVRAARAFAPGHVTGIFRPETTHRDPRGRGSVGAGVILELGAWAEARFTPGPRSEVRVAANGEGPWPITLDVARRLAPKRSGSLRVHVTHELPVGQGFGMSAAGSLATALAVGALSAAPRAKAVSVAHLADFFGGGGLGGVPAILGGGLEVRTRPGIPPFGRVLHRAFPYDLLVGVVGPPIPSPSVLGDRTSLEKITTASDGWEVLEQGASVEQFFELSERFTDRVDLASPAVKRAVTELRRRGAWACQAMFGESFFALHRSNRARVACLEWLERSDLRAVEVSASPNGARRVPFRSG